MVEHLERRIARLDREIEERLAPQKETMERLDAITGVSQRVLETLFAEIGWDLGTFPDAAHLASWVGICPGQHESGGKRMSGGHAKGIGTPKPSWCKPLTLPERPRRTWEPNFGG
jgi:transposase